MLEKTTSVNRVQTCFEGVSSTMILCGTEMDAQQEFPVVRFTAHLTSPNSSKQVLPMISRCGSVQGEVEAQMETLS